MVSTAQDDMLQGLGINPSFISHEDIGRKIDGRSWEDSGVIGVKFINKDGCTVYDGKPQRYLLPEQNPDGSFHSHQWTYPKDGMATSQDGKDCGPHRLHLMMSINARYAPSLWQAWYALGMGVMGASDEKAGVQKMTLLSPIDIPALARAGHLQRANLSEANLFRANLSKANLFEANLSEANLFRANLSKANLPGAKLSGAKLGTLAKDSLRKRGAIL